jgi:glyoxylase-like metal-dependent hydrolase (beta-lactamase superfamily II)
MGAAELIHDGIHLVGGGSLSHFQDATAFIVECGTELVMIDSGAGKGSKAIEKNIRDIPLDPARISFLILTHCHVDHIGGVKYFHDSFGCKVAAHELDAAAIETGDPSLTAASWYGATLPRIQVDRRFHGEHEVLSIGSAELHCIHTPGHTPGSICIWLDRGGKRVLFGQDIHGPFSREFHSNIDDWRDSMEKLVALQADILCEGHFGIFIGKKRVESYIRGYLDQYAGSY